MAKRVVTIWLLLILTATGGHSQQSKTVSAKEILDRMVSVYGSCKSYMDKGETKEVFFRTGGRTGGSQVVIKPFTTAFVRPSDFRFEVTENRDLITAKIRCLARQRFHQKLVVNKARNQILRNSARARRESDRSFEHVSPGSPKHALSKSGR